mmetsp:Transcript_2609/g.4887  ORF Transcript_2609/g.4887 Transcript_2609/m.4887 type:complete len:202 (-) Transcript_2609:124-729(-)
MARSVLQVEVDGLVAELSAVDLGQNILENLMIPGLRGVLHHHLDGVVELVIMSVQEAGLRPVMVLLANANHFVGIDTAVEQFDVLHKSLRLVLGIQNAQLSKHAHVGPLVPQPSLHEGDQLFKVPSGFIEMNQRLQLICMHNDVQCAHLCQPELRRINACTIHFLPRLDAVGLLGSIHSSIEALQSHQRNRQAGVVGDAGK